MRDRLTALRKAFDKEVKEREAAANKAVCNDERLLFSYNLLHFQAVEALIGYFNENPQAETYLTIVDVEGNAKVFATAF